jgi:hypothetical protein
MEHETRFDLTAAMENWRQGLAAEANLTAEVRRELDTHLRDTVAEFQGRGLNDEEAFWLARRRVGHPQQLDEEFAKANPTAVWRERLFWIWIGLFLLNVLTNMDGAAVQALQPVNAAGKFSMTKQLMMALLGIFPAIPVMTVAMILVAMRSARVVRLFSMLAPLFRNRLRLAVAGFFIAAMSSAFRALGTAMYLARTEQMRHGRFPDSSWTSWSVFVTGFFYQLVILLVLVWLVPKQTGKRLKRT